MADREFVGAADVEQQDFFTVVQPRAQVRDLEARHVGEIGANFAFDHLEPFAAAASEQEAEAQGEQQDQEPAHTEDYSETPERPKGTDCSVPLVL
jgi:hypothetical protein